MGNTNSAASSADASNRPSELGSPASLSDSPRTSQKQAMRAAEYIVLGIKREPVINVNSLILEEKEKDKGGYADGGDEQEEDEEAKARAAFAAQAAAFVSVVPGHQWVSYDGPQGGDDMGSFHEFNQGGPPPISSCWLPFVEEVRILDRVLRTCYLYCY